MEGDKGVIPPTPYKFTPEEMRVLQQCNSESFYQRSLPLATILGSGIYFSVKAGYIKSNFKYGAVPKVVSAVLAGYLIGKISYQKKCAEKLMALPNSELGAMLRNRKNKGGFQDTFGMDIPSTYSSQVTVPERDIYSDHMPTFSDLNTDRPYNKGLDDTYRPSLDSTTPLRDEDFVMPPSSSQSITSYDELRRRNREEYEQKRTKAYRSAAPEDMPTSIPERDKYSEVNRQEDSWNKPKNIYGDVFEK